MTMADHHQSDINESTPLNTQLETLAPEATERHDAAQSTDSTPTAQNSGTQPGNTEPSSVVPDEQFAVPAAAASPAASVETGDAAPPADTGISASADDLDYDADDFAAALASFDREQAAEKDAAQSLTAEEAVVTGTVVKITDKHVVIDIGLKSEGLIPIEQVLNPDGTPKFQAGDQVEVVVEREEPEGGYLVSYDKALRHKVWDTLEAAANDKVPVKGMVLSRVKGGLTVDIGIKAFLPGSQVEVRPVRNLDGYIGTEIEVRVIKLNKKRGNVVISRKELLEEEQNGEEVGNTVNA